MISRAQQILFAFLVVAIVVMSAILIRLRERAHDRLQAIQNAAPMMNTAGSATQNITLVIPNDLDGALQESQRSLPLPSDDNDKARVIIETLLETFHDPHSTHPIAAAPVRQSELTNPEANAGIDNLFLMSVPRSSPVVKSPNTGTLAVIDFSAAFAASHPSGIEPETLTLLAILGTLHANIPSITQVRFLIDGHPAQTLAGHADLTRTYLTAGITTGIGAPQS